MKKLFMKRHEENWLRIPYEENADPCIITISDSTGKKETIQMKVSKTIFRQMVRRADGSMQ